MKFRFILLIILCSFIFIFNRSGSGAAIEVDSQISFNEVWGYLMRGEEKYFVKDAPITDIFYFSASVNEKGRISTSVKPPFKPVFAGGKQRIHLVISDLSNPGRMHLCLNKKYGVRYYLIKDIVEVSAKFDGIQIDFEAVRNRDARAFIIFLRDLKKALPEEKTLSVAIPAKRMDVDDAYDYAVISGIAHRVLVMAYDQHWSSSKPGPVASLKWCREVAAYASKNISRKKLIMGLPLYGREWGDQGYSRALRWNQVNALMERDDAVIEYSLEEGFKVMFNENLRSTLYYDDIKATRQKLTMYSDYTAGVGFWRLGMETEGLWNIIRVSDVDERFSDFNIEISGR